VLPGRNLAKTIKNKKAWQDFPARLFYQIISVSKSAQKRAQRSAAGGMAQAADRFFFNLPYPLTGQVKAFTDFFQR
jgi:hypothetical protein